MLTRLNGAKSAVECGTSYGVSTIYLALAISQNAGGKRDYAFGVYTVEKDEVKTERARALWKEAGKEVEDWILPHKGDLLKILAMKELLPESIDVLFLDGMSACYWAFPLSLADRFSMDIPCATSVVVGNGSTPSRLTNLR
jgi:predicted O-methyltransferase YrrM